MDIKWVTRKRGSYTNRVAMVDGVRLAVFLPFPTSTQYRVTVDGWELKDEFATPALAKAAAAEYLAELGL